MKKLIQKKLMWGVVVIVVTQILGMLPALDFLPPIYLKLVSFSLGIALTIAKGIEMFFDQSAQLERTDESTASTTAPDGTVPTQVNKTTTTITPPQP